MEGANIKLASVVSDITGKSARLLLAELVAGADDAEAMATLSVGQLRKKRDQLERALRGRMSDHHRFMVAQHVAQIDHFDDQVEVLSQEIAQRLAPFEAQVTILDSIPGIGRWSAEVILAEIGPDMSRFPTAGHLASWAGMCPGTNERGGKRRTGRTRNGSPHVRVTLTEAGYAASRMKDSVLADRYHRLIVRRGKKKTAIAVGRTILELCHLLLSTGQLDTEDQARIAPSRAHETEQERLVHRLENLGHRVILQPAA